VATGLSFSTAEDVSSGRVASIQRVLLEAKNEGFCVNLKNGNIVPWAQRGVLLLNIALTIQCPKEKSSCVIASHVPLWGGFTKALMEEINTNTPPSSFILWGSKAGAFKQYVKNPNHTIISGGHPSPFGAPHGKRFFCKNYYGCTNQWLTKHNRKKMDWNLAEQCESKIKPNYWTWNRSKRNSTVFSTCQMNECM